ncbi:hypothetical protein C8Q72DRAFT_871826 [Fomitopsis betulina]|nr:hypothetical protein C8Q72DRAFT_871826 [Fomitopsis betulina]
MAEVPPTPQTAVFLVDHKRRKITPERAKATYLCGQLRLRLQYAKLKVEHGWVSTPQHGYVSQVDTHAPTRSDCPAKWTSDHWNEFGTLHAKHDLSGERLSL